MLKKQKITQLFFAGLLMILAACKAGNDTYLYDKSGFDSGRRPTDVQQNPEGINRVAPDYYYRQAAPQDSYGQVPVQGYAPQANYQQPPRVTPVYSAGGSRYYSNPYAMPPSNQYPNYDVDQYYIPPTYYNNVEPQSQIRQVSQPNY